MYRMCNCNFVNFNITSAYLILFPCFISRMNVLCSSICSVYTLGSGRLSGSLPKPPPVTDLHVGLISSGDTIPPVTTATLIGSPGNNGWYTSDVQVT